MSICESCKRIQKKTTKKEGYLKTKMYKHQFETEYKGSCIVGVETQKDDENVFKTIKT